MEAYEKYKTVNHPLVNPFAGMLANEAYNVAEVRMSTYSVMNNVVGFAMRKLKDPKTDMAILIGQDRAGDMVLKCAEILQRNFDGLHQCNTTAYKIHEDIWVPKDLQADLDTLSVKRHIPTTFVLLAKDQLPDKLKFHPHRLQLKGGHSGANKFNKNTRTKS